MTREVEDYEKPVVIYLRVPPGLKDFFDEQARTSKPKISLNKLLIDIMTEYQKFIENGEEN